MGILLLAASAVASAARPLPAGDASTWSFSARAPATIEGAVVCLNSQIEVHLSALPRGVVGYRAVLRLGRDERQAYLVRNQPVVVSDGRGEALRLLPPRFLSFDATAAVRGALDEGKPTVKFQVVSFPGYLPEGVRLDVTCAAPARNKVKPVTGLTVRHRAGQTLLTWSEVDTPIHADSITIKEWREQTAALKAKPDQVRYRIYRSAEPISAASVARAELVDEIEPLTGWNAEYYGDAPSETGEVRRYVVDEGKGPVPRGAAVYAHNPGVPLKAYYAVSMAMNGEEDLSVLGTGNTTAVPIEETVGAGEPVLQRIEKPQLFAYIEAPVLHYYVRWEAPPRTNMPSRPFDYLVGLPPTSRRSPSAGLHLHCWGGSLNDGYGWWYNARQGAVLISTNQTPYDWWTGYHESLGTWKSWQDGVVRNFTQERLVAFLGWAASRWQLDVHRLFVAGSSMGGSGSISLGIRHPELVAWIGSWVGVHTPDRSPQFRSSYEAVYGLVDWKLRYQDLKTPAFVWFDDTWFLKQNPSAEIPLLCFANGKNDAAIGWPQARDFWKALQETRRPHVFRWGQAGHGERAVLPGPNPNERELGMDLRSDRTLPAFSNCSLDSHPGNGDPNDGDMVGQSNGYLLWETADASIVDEVRRWAMQMQLNAEAPNSDCTVDVTPRRCQKFRVLPGTKVRWRSLGPKGNELQSGEATADSWGLVTATKVRVGKAGIKLHLEVYP